MRHVCTQGQGVNFPPHMLTQGGVNSAVALQCRFSSKCSADDVGLEVHTIRPGNRNFRVRHASSYHLRNQVAIHNRSASSSCIFKCRAKAGVPAYVKEALNKSEFP
jgi:hypothetical protein